MNKKIIITLTLSYLITVFLALFFSLQWIIVSTAWFLVAFLACFLATSHNYSKLIKSTVLVAILYPIIETILKMVIFYDLIPYSYEILNRIEHFSWAFFFTILLFPVFKYFLKGINNKIVLFIVIISFVCLIGTFNEIFEFLLRTMWNLYDATYYQDTILDTVINFAGTSIATLIFLYKRLDEE
jgi:hypothetical protein